MKKGGGSSRQKLVSSIYKTRQRPLTDEILGKALMILDKKYNEEGAIYIADAVWSLSALHLTKQEAKSILRYLHRRRFILLFRDRVFLLKRRF